MNRPSKPRPEVSELVDQIGKLSDDARALVLQIVTCLLKDFQRIFYKTDSPLVSKRVVSYLGNTLRIHHCLSREPFAKDKFEYALVAAWNFDGRHAELAPRGNPGYDVVVDNTKISLKTQADKSIKDSEIHISKFMELGKGAWTDKPEQLEGLRQAFFKHMKSYDTILVLRCLKADDRGPVRYELVQVPLALLHLSKDAKLQMQMESPQNPKPGYCEVFIDSKLVFKLYFDGGTERKLQVQKIDKAQCLVVAEWEFKV